MTEISLTLFCPKCDKKFSSLKIFKKSSKVAKKELNFWENKMIIATCSNCGCYLRLIGTIKEQQNL